MKLITTKCSSIGQPEVFVELDSIVSNLGESLINYIESQVLSGVRYLDGETIEIGGNLLQIKKFEDKLTLFEPNFTEFPIKWVNGVSNTIRQLSIQNALCETFGCEAEYSVLTQVGIVSPQWNSEKGIVMSRDSSDGQDSGWVFHELGYNGSDGMYSSIYQIAIDNFRVIPYLALPSGSIIELKENYISVEVGGIQKTSVNDDTLKGIMESYL